MAENTNKKSQESKGTSNNNKNGKPKFNMNWILGAAFLGFIAINLLFGGRNITKSQEWGDVENMIVNRDIARIVVVNKDKAEIYLKPEAVESGRYPDASSGGGAFSMVQSGPNFVYNIGTVEMFDQQLAEAQERAGYTPAERIHPSYETRRNYMGDILGWILPFLIILAIDALSKSLKAN